MAYRKNLEELWIHILIVFDLLTINVLTLKGHCQLVLAGSICVSVCVGHEQGHEQGQGTLWNRCCYVVGGVVLLGIGCDEALLIPVRVLEKKYFNDSYLGRWIHDLLIFTYFLSAKCFINILTAP